MNSIRASRPTRGLNLNHNLVTARPTRGLNHNHNLVTARI
jgi:hypothetical protein